MEHGNKLLLQIAAHIDQEVATTNEIKFGEGRIFDHVMLGKNHHVANAFVDSVGAAVRLGYKKTRHPFPRKVCGDAGRIKAGTGCGNRLTVYVGGENLHLETLFHRLLALGKQNGQGISLLAGGTGR